MDGQAVTDEALHRLVLTQLDTLDKKRDADSKKADARHGVVMTTLRTMAIKQDSFTRCHEECSKWRQKHAAAHGLDPNTLPSPWVANATTWAWHHPKRTTVFSILFVALFISDFRTWLVGKATWLIGLWLAG